MSRITENAREARERVHAYVLKNPGQLSEDIWHNNARINKEMVLRTLRHLREKGMLRKEGNKQAARFFPV